MTGRAFALHYESAAALNASPPAAFAFLDDFEKLAAHMQGRSAMMLGSRMAIRSDALHGRAAGSKVRMEGRILGVRLWLEEVVMEREPPLRKIWQTLDARLLVIGPYRLGFELAPDAGGSLLRVFIDYDLPQRGLGRWLGRLLGNAYARWCTQQMVKDAAAALGTRGPRI